MRVFRGKVRYWAEQRERRAEQSRVATHVSRKHEMLHLDADSI